MYYVVCMRENKNYKYLKNSCSRRYLDFRIAIQAVYDTAEEGNMRFMRSPSIVRRVKSRYLLGKRFENSSWIPEVDGKTTLTWILRRHVVRIRGECKSCWNIGCSATNVSCCVFYWEPDKEMFLCALDCLEGSHIHTT